MERLRQIQSKANKKAGDTAAAAATSTSEKTTSQPKQDGGAVNSSTSPPPLSSSKADAGADNKAGEQETVGNSGREKSANSEDGAKADGAKREGSGAQQVEGSGGQEESAQQKFCKRLQGPNSVFSQEKNECVCREGWAEDTEGNCNKKVEAS